MSIVYLCLGSNIPDRVGYIQQATRLLGAHDKIKIIRTSTLYETEPFEKKQQNWFVNAVVELKTSLSPDDFLNVVHSIEEKLGRNRDEKDKYADRTIDIDILFWNSEIINQSNLQIPHYALHQRAFVLVPLMELTSEFVHPIFKKTIEQLHDELDEPEDVYLYGTKNV